MAQKAQAAASGKLAAIAPPAVEPSSVTPAPASASSTDQTREQLLDEYGELDRKYRLWKPDLDRYEALKVIIKPWFEEGNAAPDKPGSLQGHLWIVQATAKQNERRPLILKIWRFFGRQVFFDQIIEITQAAVKRALITRNLTVPPAEQLDPEKGCEQFFSEKARTGYRKLTAVLKNPPVQEKAA